MTDGNLPAIADGEDHALDPRSIVVQRIGGGISTALVAAGSLVGVGIFGLSADDVPGWLRAAPVFLWLALTAALAWHSYRWPAIDYRHASYRVDEQGIEIRKGVYWRVTINVPRSRVQHTDVAQGPLERKYGLGTLVIYTAGTEHSRVDLPGLEHGVALRIREHLLPSGAADAV